MTQSVKTDVKRVTIGNFILGALMLVVFALVDTKYFPGAIWGALLGCSYVSLSFLWLAISVSRNVEKDPDNAKKRVAATYTYRLLAMAAVIILSIKVDCFNWVATIIPILCQRIVVEIVGAMRSKENEKKEVSE